MKSKAVRMLLAAVTAVAVVGASACSGSDDESGSGGGDGEQAASPISEFLDQTDFATDQEAAEAQFVEEERARQEIIAECMAEQGFEYTPIDPGEMISFGSEGDLEWGSDEWVEKYGFGITTMWFSQEEVGPDLVGYDDALRTGGGYEDPNQDMLDAMTEQEQEAYYTALYGDQSAIASFDETMSEEELAEEELIWEPAGCEGEAYEQDSSNQFYLEFQDELDEMYQRIESDPRIVEAREEVSACVAERGFTYTDEEDMWMEFDAELQEIDQMAPWPGADLTEEDYNSMSDDELDAIFSQPRDLPPEALDMLAELQAEEIELAVVVNECGGGFQNQQELFQEVQFDLEQEFLEEHQDQLAEFEGAADGA